MSGRRGYGVKADDLLDELVRRATAEVASRNEHLAPDAQAALGAQIAAGRPVTYCSDTRGTRLSSLTSTRH